MSAFMLMLGVAACYTVTSLSDKYAAAKAKFPPDAFTFLMCASMSVFLALTLPFQTLYFDLRWQTFLGILLTAACKLLEFSMSIKVLRQITAFELKAWLGVTVFASYFTDILLGGVLQWMKLICIAVTALGLILIVCAEKPEPVDYKKLWLPLALYLLSKFGYGLVIRTFSVYASSVCILLPALVLAALCTLPRVAFSEYREKKIGTAITIFARIPNAAGMLMENAVIAISLAQYSLIQPMILVTLFVIGFLRKEYGSARNLIGGIICMAGVIGFQFVL